MAAYLLYRFESLCMFIFHQVSPSLAKKSMYVLYIAGNNNKFDSMISVT